MTTAATPVPLRQQFVAEFVGTATLLCAVIGSGSMAQRLCGGNVGLTLLANTLATVFALYVLIETLGPISGAHLNPVVTLVLWSKRAMAQVNTSRAATLFIAAQLLGAVAGAAVANVMFELPRAAFKPTSAGWLGPVLGRRRSHGRTDLHHPARSARQGQCFAGIAPSSALGFMLAQCVGAAAGALLAQYLNPLSAIKANTP